MKKETPEQKHLRWTGRTLIIYGLIHIPWIVLSWIRDYKFWAIIYVVAGLLFIIWGYALIKEYEKETKDNVKRRSNEKN